MVEFISLNFGFHPLTETPKCPYIGLSCRKFNVNLARGVCCKGDSRCSWLPYWVASVSGGCYAILKEGKLHV